MKVQVLTGSKQQIAATLVSLSGEVRETVAFVDEPSEAIPHAAGEDIFTEMAPFTVEACGVDYSREGLYNRMAGE